MKHFLKPILAVLLAVVPVLAFSQPAHAALGSNLVVNPSVEQSTNGAPTAWSKNSWGTNTTSYAYLETGYNSAHSIKVRISAYSSGDAKWMPRAVAVTAGADYVFSNYYKSSVATEVDAVITMADGSSEWYWVGSAPSSANTWQHFVSHFEMPAGAVKARFVQILDQVGSLTTDAYSLRSYTADSFNRALVSLTFDDAWRSIYTNGKPLLDQKGYKSTQYLLSGVTTYPDYMTLAMMKSFRDGGHEIASHTVDHFDLTTLSNSELMAQLNNSKQWFQANLGVEAKNFATPYGAYNSTVLNAIKQVYASHRGVEDGYNSRDNLDIYDIKVQNLVSSTTITEFNSWLSQAKANKSWLVLVYHQIGASGEYNTPSSSFASQLNAVQASGLSVVTVQQALTELKPQL